MGLFISSNGWSQKHIGIIDTSHISTHNSNEFFIIRSISIEGNKKTKPSIILREMTFAEEDTLSQEQIRYALKKSQEQIYNTTLFLKVDLTPLVDSNQIDLKIQVEERWYIFPFPYFQLADRSFNEWINTYNADLSRISYGLLFTHFNFTGRKDRLSLILINGFKRNISFEYVAPAINKNLTTGIKLGAGFEQTKEIPISTDTNNKLVYYKTDQFVKNDWFLKAAVIIRKRIKKTETFTLKLGQVSVSDSIISTYNPDYFFSNSSRQFYTELEYWLQYNDVDNIMYPLKGNTLSLKLIKKGIGWSGGINQFTIKPNLNWYFPLHNNWYFSLRTGAEINLPLEQPYFNKKGLGYREDYLRGYQYYVMDGPIYLYSKLDLKKKLLYFTIPTFLKPSSGYSRIPFTIYAKTFADFGYSYNAQKATLNNRFLYTGGVGFDIVMVHDFKISFEFALNQLGQKGLFLHP